MLILVREAMEEPFSKTESFSKLGQSLYIFFYRGKNMMIDFSKIEV